MRNTTTIRLTLSAMAFGAIIAAIAIPRPAHAGSDAEEAKAARAAFNTKQSAIYNYKWGTEHPFWPSNATTDDGTFIDPRSFPTAQYCGHCHQESHAEWRQSVHSNSNRVPYYLRNVNLLAADKGIANTRHCEGCHDPIALVSGALTEKSPRTRPYDQDGVTCSVCHSIKSVDTRGTGSYVMGVPAVLLDENGAPITRPVSDSEILAHLDRHSAAVMKPFYRTSEYCSACHKAALPKPLNEYKWQRAISLYDEWQNASFARESPLPFYKKDVVSTCETCHMQREPLGALPDPGSKKGTLASHRWLGANTVIPQIYHFDEQAKRIVEFLQAANFNVDIFALEPETPAEGQPALIAPLGATNYKLLPGQRVVASVIIQNKGIAHSHVPEQRDMYESYVNFTVKNAAGKTIAESGFIQPKDQELDPSAHSFTNRLINKQGTLNEFHQVWNNRVVAFNNTIQSGRSQLIRYAFALPKSGGPVTITATVKYRRFDQHFADFGMSMTPGQHYSMPIVDMASESRTVQVGDNTGTANAATVKPAQPENTEWQRWNNFGIALLDAQQYAAAVAAFQHVAGMRKDYADAQTNIGLTYIQWEKYDEARPFLEAALLLSKDAKDKARATYYLALVERNSGDVDGAIEHLKAVAKDFPRSRDAHRELGFSYYQQHKYAEAKAEYLLVQSIDPDDLAAHYNLAILYRRLGDKDKAAVEAAYFADQKDDPTASTFALEWLRKHHEIAQETVPWHVHDLSHKGADEAEPALPAVPVTPVAPAAGGGGR